MLVSIGGWRVSVCEGCTSMFHCYYNGCEIAKAANAAPSPSPESDRPQLEDRTGGAEGSEQSSSTQGYVWQARCAVIEHLDAAYAITSTLCRDLWGEGLETRHIEDLYHAINRLRVQAQNLHAPGPRHTCGLQGYNPMLGHTCPACASGAEVVSTASSLESLEDVGEGK